MQIELEFSIQAALERISRERGKPTGDLLRDAVHGYVSEITQLRTTLDARYDDILNGSVGLIDGAEAFTEVHRRIELRRKKI